MSYDSYMIALIFASIVAFAIHNFEEAFGIEDWVSRLRRPTVARLYSRKTFLLAANLLWALYLVVAVSAMLLENAAIQTMFALGLGAIVANGILHIITVPFFRRRTPGFWSALLLVVPIGTLVAWHATNTGILAANKALAFLLAGAVLQLPLAAGALRISYAITSKRNEGAAK